MRLVSMRSTAGEDPVIVATPEAGESPHEGDTVEGGAGVVFMVSPANVAIRCSVIGGDRPLPRRVRDGLRNLSIDPPARGGE